ncbi:MAG: hypothetical protein K2W33_05435, partial [Burkholderiales bacterium]|nr:hypothetical protein [Burkholderiales bacterium]
MSNPLVQPKTANPGYNGLGAVFQFVLLMAVFTVVLAAYVGSIMFDKRQTMQVVAELKNDTVPLMVKQLRLARNLDTLRFEADQAIRSDTLERRSQGQFYVSVHARDLDFLTDAVVSSQVDELVYLLKQADDAPTEAYLARWADVSERLKRSADQIALEAIVLGQQSVVTVESDLNESLQASFYLLMVGVVLQLLTLLYVGKVFIRPLKKLGAHLASMGGPEPPGAIDLATHTTEIQAIERAVNTLVTTMHDNRQM